MLNSGKDVDVLAPYIEGTVKDVITLVEDNRLMADEERREDDVASSITELAKYNEGIVEEVVTPVEDNRLMADEEEICEDDATSATTELEKIMDDALSAGPSSIVKFSAMTLFVT